MCIRDSCFRVNLQNLLPFPAHTALGVFEDDPLLQEAIPDAVGERKVAGLLGRGTLRHAGFDCGIGKLAGSAAGLEHVEDGIEEAEKLQRCLLYTSPSPRD